LDPSRALPVTARAPDKLDQMIGSTPTPPPGPSLPTLGETPDGASALPSGTRVAEFEVRRVLGSGGFGIVYLAWDHALEREVALKEYMPGTLAGRGHGLSVSLRSQAMADTFALGLKSFVNEARLLARFDHPSLVKVYRFWEDNGTAYMVMPYYVGRTLRQARAGMVMPPGEGACRHVLDALLSALEVLHKEGVYHRDIAPDNILLGDDGIPVLLDFGAARRVIGEGNKALTSIMKPHFAPLEQYADQSAMRQGPWTDLYALGGTIYFLITGREPVPAASRALHDDQPRLSELRPADCSPGFLAAIDWMLALKPPERPQSVHMLRDVLEGRITLPGRTAGDRTAPGVAAHSTTTVDILTEPGALGGTTGLGTPAAPSTQPPAQRTQVMAAPAAAAAPTPAPATHAPAAAVSRWSSSPLVLGLLVVLNVFAWWWFTRGAEPASAAASPPTLAVPAPAPVPAPTSSGTVHSGTVAPADGGGTETILSVLPARAPRAASAPASAPALVRSADPLPRVTGTPAASAPAASAPLVAVRPARAASVAATVAEPQGPRARCGDRNFLSMLVCMKRECGDPVLTNHPECVKLREQEEAGMRSGHQR
jgi:serine/threonine protein kinase